MVEDVFLLQNSRETDIVSIRLLYHTLYLMSSEWCGIFMRGYDCVTVSRHISTNSAPYGIITVGYGRHAKGGLSLSFKGVILWT